MYHRYTRVFGPSIRLLALRKDSLLCIPPLRKLQGRVILQPSPQANAPQGA